MKIVLDTSIRPSCYCCTTRTVCHENRAGHKYPSIVLLLHDKHSVCHENRAGHKIRPSCYCYTTRTVCVMKIVLDTSIRPLRYCYTTRTVSHENRAGHKYPSIVLLLHDTHSVS